MKIIDFINILSYKNSENADWPAPPASFIPRRITERSPVDEDTTCDVGVTSKQPTNRGLGVKTQLCYVAK